MRTWKVLLPFAGGAGSTSEKRNDRSPSSPGLSMFAAYVSTRGSPLQETFPSGRGSPSSPGNGSGPGSPEQATAPARSKAPAPESIDRMARSMASAYPAPVVGASTPRGDTRDTTRRATLRAELRPIAAPSGALLG